MKHLFLGLGVFSLIICLACSPNKKEANTSETKNIQAEIQQSKPEDTFEKLRNDPNYEKNEEYLRMQIDIHYMYFYYTPEGKAEPEIKREESLDKLLSTVKSRYSLTDQQVDTIRNNKLYIGMPRTCVYLAWGKYRDSLGLSPDEVKTVSAGMEKVKMTFQVRPGKYKTAFFENDVLVSYQE